MELDRVELSAPASPGIAPSRGRYGSGPASPSARGTVVGSAARWPGCRLADEAAPRTREWSATSPSVRTRGSTLPARSPDDSIKAQRKCRAASGAGLSSDAVGVLQFPQIVRISWTVKTFTGGSATRLATRSTPGSTQRLQALRGAPTPALSYRSTSGAATKSSLLQ